MKILVTTLILSSLLFGAPVIAGSGHTHSHAQTPANQETVEKNAEKVLVSLAERKKLDGSWASITAASAEKKQFNGRSEWVVIFINDNIADTNKQKIYVFMTLAGEYIAANYTGN